MKTSDEERLAALEAEIAALRKAQQPPAPKPEPPRFRTIDGQGPAQIDAATGERMLAAADPSTTTVGGNVGFGKVWRTVNGERQWRPDGGSFARDPQSGEIVHHVGPTRSPAHERAVEMIDAMLPIVPMRVDPD